MRRPRLVLLVVLASALAACAEQSEVAVDVRTDLVAGEEFDSVFATLDEVPAPVLPVGRDDAFSRLRRVAEFGGVEAGPHAVRVDLRLRGETVLSRRVALRVTSSLAVAVVMTRDCRSVRCPGAGDAPDATECLAGRCVAPDCARLGEAGCAASECTNDVDCGGGVACVLARCALGVCLEEAEPMACAATEYCNPDEGCLPRSTEARDAGPDLRDAGPDLRDAWSPPPTPVLVLSASRDGPALTSQPVDRALYGRALHLPEVGTESCVDVIGTSDGYCDTLSNWTPMPNADWSYDGAAWRAAFAPFVFPPGSYRLAFRDATTGARSAFVVLTLTPARPELIFSSSPGGAARTAFTVSSSVHGRALHLGPDDAEACVEVVGTSDGYCDALVNWTPMPNADWSYDAGLRQWRATFAPATFPPGSYRLAFRNTTTGDRSAPVVLTLTP